MELGHLLTRFCLTLLEIPLKISPDFFCLFVCSFLVFSVIYSEAFCLYVAANFSCIPVFLPQGAAIRNTIASPLNSHPHFLVVCPVHTNEAMTNELQRYNCFIWKGGNTIPKHACPEAKSNNPTTGLNPALFS